MHSTSSSSSSRAVDVTRRRPRVRAMSKRSSVRIGRRPAERHGQRAGLARQPGGAVLVLDDAVEEHGEEAAVHQARRPFVDDRERDAARRRLGVEVVELVLGKARVERADVEGVREVDALRLGAVRADPRRGVRRRPRPPVRSPTRRSASSMASTVGMGDAPATAAGRRGAGARPRRRRSAAAAAHRIAVCPPPCRPSSAVPFAAFLANLYRIVMVYLLYGYPYSSGRADSTVSQDVGPPTAR